MPFIGAPDYGTFTNTTETRTVELVCVHPEDRKHVTKDDITRLEENGFVVVFCTHPVRFAERAP